MVDDLDKKKHDLRAINKSGQTLIRHLDSQDHVENELDKLSDNYYSVLDKAKDKRDEKRATLSKVNQLSRNINEIEDWIKEVNGIVEKISQPTTDLDVMKSRLEEIQVWFLIAYYKS